MTRINRNTLAALKELRWKYRAETVSDAIDCLLYLAEPELFKEYISEDEPDTASCLRAIPLQWSK